jgi:type I restriction enzyme S subunit
MKNNKSRTNIPHGWSKCRLNEVADFFNGKGHEKNINENGKYVVVNSKFISTNGKIRKYCNEFLAPLQKDDVVMVMSDVPNGKAIAKCFFVDKNNKYTLNQRIGGFKSKNIFNKFLFLAINRNRYFLSFDDGVNQTNLRKDDILACPLILPPLPEQKRIVSVLETWDRMIEKLAKKIEIKKNVKKGLMQNLLTGKVRLAGFKDEWKTFKLKELGDVRTSSVDKKIIEGEKEVSLLNYMDVYRRDHIRQNDVFQKVTAKEQQVISSNLKKGDVLFTPSSETQDDIGHSAVVIEDLDKILFSYHIMRFRPKNNILYYRFSAYCFKTYNFYLELWKKSQGATRYTLSKEALESSKINIPLSLKEQKYIADILITADSEIKMLEKKLSIIKDQKKYLLDNLVTGQIRVPEFKK